jgi:hypothetical protein
MRADPILRCLDDTEGLNNEHFPSWCGPRVHELANGLRLGTAVPSQDLSGAWVTVHGCELARKSASSEDQIGANAPSPEQIRVKWF